MISIALLVSCIERVSRIDPKEMLAFSEFRQSAPTLQDRMERLNSGCRLIRFYRSRNGFVLSKDHVMKRGIPSLVLLALSLLSSTGCIYHRAGACSTCNGPIGCRPCRVAWQRGGTDYGAHLSHSEYRRDNQVGSGVASATVGYPYYTSRGPRDFLANNPPSIGR